MGPLLHMPLLYGSPSSPPSQNLSDSTTSYYSHHCSGSIPNGSLSLFTQILISSFGYTSKQALALSAPSGLVAVVMVLLVGRLSDRWNNRTLVIFISLVPTIIGGVLLVSLERLLIIYHLLAAMLTSTTSSIASGRSGNRPIAKGRSSFRHISHECHQPSVHGQPLLRCVQLRR